MPTMPHFCHVHQCNVEIPLRAFLCERHTAMLSPELQIKITKVLRPVKSWLDLKGDKYSDLLNEAFLQIGEKVA